MGKKKKKKPTLSACMIVKNEETLLKRCLKSITPLIDELIIVDTGSTDNTLEIAKSYNARIYHHPWEKNFSTHRNQSIDYATGDWILVIDADEELDSSGLTKKELKQRLAKAEKNVNAFLVNIVEKNALGGTELEIMRPRFFRRKAGIRYQGIVHNIPEFKAPPIPMDLNIFHYGHSLPKDKMLDKYKRTAELLQIRLHHNSEDYPACFYLSQICLEMNQEDLGIEYAQKCLDLLDTSHVSNGDIEFYYGIYHILALALIHRENYSEAVATIRKGLERIPHNPSLYYDLACAGYFLQDTDLIIEGGEAFLDRMNGQREISSTIQRPFTVFFETPPEPSWTLDFWLMYAYLKQGRLGDSQVLWKRSSRFFMETAEIHESLLSGLEQAGAWEYIEEFAEDISNNKNFTETHSLNFRKSILEYQILFSRRQEKDDALKTAVETYLALGIDYDDMPLFSLVLTAEALLRQNQGKHFLEITSRLLTHHMNHQLQSVKNTEKLALAYQQLALQQDETEKGTLTALSCFNIAWILTDDQRYLKNIRALKKKPEPTCEQEECEAQATSAAIYQTAFTEIDITPKVSVENPVLLQGIPGRERAATVTESPLKMQILLLEDQEHSKLLFVSADLFGFGNEMVKHIKNKAWNWGIKPEAVILNASHTHYAPGTLSHVYPSMGKYFKKYAMEIADLIIKSLTSLTDTLEPTRIFYGKTRFSIGPNRSVPEEDFSPSSLETERDLPHTPFLLLEQKKSKKSVLVVNYGCKPDGLGSEDVISADFPGYFREELKNSGKATYVMYFQGAAGDIHEGHPADAPIQQKRATSRQNARENGIYMAQSIASALDKEYLTPLTESSVSCSTRTMYLPLKKIPDITQINDLKNNSGTEPVIREWAKRLSANYPSGKFPNALALNVQVIDIGKRATFICFPAGPVSKLGIRLKEQMDSPDQTFILGYTNGIIGDLPDDDTISRVDYNKHLSSYYYMVPYFLGQGTEKEIFSKVQQCCMDIYSPESEAPSEAKDPYEKYRDAMRKTIWDYTHYAHQRHPESKLDTDFFRKKELVAPLIDKSTPISSMGSCFARNIAIYLMNNNYNYLVTETPFLQASAHWDQVFNTACMRQIYEYTFLDNWNPMVRWWPKENMMQEPFRRATLYPKATCSSDFEKHRLASYNALSNADVIILTLGLIETWRDKRDKMTYYKVPSPRLYNPDIHEFHIQTTEECLSDLNRIHELICKNNPEINFIVTVSPVPLDATFRNDVDIVTANMFSKSTLRVTAEYFASSHKNVYYFPSYEIITSVMNKPYEEDKRHIRTDAIKEMMEIFRTWFMVE